MIIDFSIAIFVSRRVPKGKLPPFEASDEARDTLDRHIPWIDSQWLSGSTWIYQR